MAAPVTGLDAQLGMRRGGFDLDASIQVAPGETVALVGPNGAGKSSAVRAITGLTPLDSGRVELQGRVLDDPDRSLFVPPHERNIGTAFQDNLLFPHRRVRDNVGFRLGRKPSAEARAEADVWMHRLGIAELADRRATDLSGGQARRVSIARALVGAPDLVLLDEPFAGLDVDAARSLRSSLNEHLAASRAGRLVITHDPGDAQTIADRVIVLEHGRITQAGTPAEIRRRPASAYVANLVGVNLVRGRAHSGHVTVEGDGPELAIVDHTVSGQVIVTFSPHAVALHPEAPHGSPRNTWLATVGELHRLGEIVRVHLREPIPVVADVTESAVAELRIEPGRRLWVAVKATGFDVASA